LLSARAAIESPLLKLVRLLNWLKAFEKTIFVPRTLMRAWGTRPTLSYVRRLTPAGLSFRAGSEALMRPGCAARLYSLRRNSCFVSGHDFRSCGKTLLFEGYGL
jgi:hypothetical protein